MKKSNHKGLVSIIVPIYNVEKYLYDCFNSINNSTYQNIQLILIDDESKDDSFKIAKTFHFKTKNVVIKQIKHSGVSYARNIGLRYAKGEFVYFLDADDILHPLALSNFVNEMLNDSSLDLVGANFKRIKHNITYSDINYSLNLISKTIYKGDEIIPEILKGWNTTPNWSIWNKLYRLEILRKIKNFPNILDTSIYLGEDMYFVSSYLKHCNKAIFLNGNLYYHRLRKDSLSCAKYSDEEISVTKCLKPLSGISKAKYPNSYNAYKAMECFNAFILIHRIKNNNNLSKKQLIELKNMFLNNFKYTKQFASTMKLFSFMKIIKAATLLKINNLINKK